MNKNIAYLAIFASGVAIGSVASWIVAKKKYEQIAQEDFLSRKETLAKKLGVDRKTLRKWVNGGNIPASKLSEMADIFKCSTEYLLETR